MKVKTFLRMIPVILLFFACTDEVDQTPAGRSTDTHAMLVADDIIYDVEIKNPNKDDPWMDKALEGLQREELIGIIFNGVYDNSLEAYDIFEGTRISAKKIRQMEEDGELIRDKIGKFQFTEQWMYDSLNHIMTKKVSAISLGTQRYDTDGYLIGYYPLFKVILP